MDLYSVGLTIDPTGMVAGGATAEAALHKVGHAAEETEVTVLGATEVMSEAMGKLAAIFTVGFIGEKLIAESTTAQYAMAQLNAAVTSTGHAAGFTANQLHEQAMRLQELSTFSHVSIEAAQSILLMYTNIRGTHFEEAEQAAVNLATRMRSDVPEAAKTLGKALENPTTGLMMLRRAGIVFAQDQVDLIKTLAATGHLEEAQTMILDQLTIKLKDSGEAARETLGGALENLKHTFLDLFESTEEETSSLVRFINTVDHGLKTIELYKDATKSLGEMLGGVLVAVIVTKTVPAMLTFAGTMLFSVKAAFGAAEVAGTGFAGVLIGLKPLLNGLLLGLGPIALLATAASLAIYDLNAAFDDEDSWLNKAAQKWYELTGAIAENIKIGEEAQRSGPAYTAYLKALGTAEAHAPTVAKADTDTIDDKTQKTIDERYLQVEKLQALNKAFGESTLALKLLGIQYDAYIQKKKDAIDHSGKELTALNAATDAMLKQQLAAAKLEDAHKQEQEVFKIVEEMDKATNSRVKAIRDMYDEEDAHNRLYIAVQKGTEAYKEQVKIENIRNAVKQSGFKEGDAEYKDVVRTVTATYDLTEAIKAVIEAQKEWTKFTNEHTTALENFDKTVRQVAASINHDLLSGISSLTKNGLTSFEAFLGEVEKLSLKLVSTLTSTLSTLQDELMKAFDRGDDALMKSISDEMDGLEKLAGVAKGVGAAVTGALAGYSIGYKTGSTDGGFFGGGAAGALGGAEIAGPWGAAIGGLVGAASGLFGASKKQEEAAAALKQAAMTAYTAFVSKRDAYLAGPVNSVAGQVTAENSAYTEMVKAWQSSGEYFGQEPGGAQDQLASAHQRNIQSIADTFFGGITQALNALKGPAGDYANQLLAIEKTYNDNIVAAKALNATSDQLQAIEDLRAQTVKKLSDAYMQVQTRELQDLQVRALAAAGNATGSSDLQFQLQQQREYQDAQTSGKSAGYLSSLQSVLAAEALKHSLDEQLKKQTDAINAQLATSQAMLDTQIANANTQIGLLKSQLSVEQQTAQTTHQVVTTLSNFSDSLKLSGLSPLTPIQQLAEAQKQYQALLSKAMGGDATSANALPGAAQTYLGLDRSIYASSSKYADDFARVQQDVEAITAQFANRASTADLIAEALQHQIDMFTQQIQISTDAKTQAATDAAKQIAILQATETNQLQSAQVQLNIQSLLAQLVSPTFVPASAAPTIEQLTNMTTILTTSRDVQQTQVNVLTDGFKQLKQALADVKSAVDAGTQSTALALEAL